MTAGEGGILTSNDGVLADRAWSFANCGRPKGGKTYDHESIASNFRMTEWQAAILGAQLQRYPEQFETRARAAHMLDTIFETVQGITPQKPHKSLTARAYYCYVFRVDPNVFGIDATIRVFDTLSQAGVPLSLPYPSLSELQLFVSGNFGPSIRRAIEPIRFQVPIAEQLSRNTIWLHHPALLASDAAITMLADLVIEAAKGN